MMKSFYLTSYFDKKVIISSSMPRKDLKTGFWILEDPAKSLTLPYNSLEEVFDIKIDYPGETSIKVVYSKKLEERFEKKLKFLKLFDEFEKKTEEFFGDTYKEVSISLEKQGDCSGIIKYTDNTIDYIL